MLFGLGIGLALAVGVYLTDARAPGDAAGIAADRSSAPATTPDTTMDRRIEQGRVPEPDSAPATAAVREDPASRFDFYEILPQFEVVIPEVDRGVRVDTSPTSVSTPGQYVLQAGSFRSHADADRMQASLALLGIEARIQRVTIDDDVYHRVRVGPIEELDELNRVRRQLHDSRIETLIMRVAQ